MPKIEVIHRTKTWPKPEIGPHAFPWPHTDTITEVSNPNARYGRERWVFIKRESKDRVGYRIEMGPRSRPISVWPHKKKWSADGYKASVKFEEKTGLLVSDWEAVARHWTPR